MWIGDDCIMSLDNVDITVLIERSASGEESARDRLNGQPCTAKSDLWSLGVVGYEMLSGCKPFPGTQRDELQSEILAGPAKLSSAIPEDMHIVVGALLVRDPDARPASAQWVIDTLEEQSKLSFRNRLIPLLALVLVLGWFMGARENHAPSPTVVEFAPFAIEASVVDSGLAAGLYESVLQQAGQRPGLSIRRRTGSVDISADATPPTWRVVGSFGSDHLMTIELMDVTLNESVWQFTLPFQPDAWVGLDREIVQRVSSQLETEQRRFTWNSAKLNGPSASWNTP